MTSLGTVERVARRQTLIMARSATRSLSRAGVVPAALAVIVALGAALRLWHLDHVGYNSDEAVYAGQAAALAHSEPLASLFPAFRAHPLVVQGLLSVVYRFSFSEAAGRLLSVAFGLGTIV